MTNEQTTKQKTFNELVAEIPKYQDAPKTTINGILKFFLCVILFIGFKVSLIAPFFLAFWFFGFKTILGLVFGFLLSGIGFYVYQQLLEKTGVFTFIE